MSSISKAKLSAAITSDNAFIESRSVRLEISLTNGFLLKHLINHETGSNWIPQPATFPWGSETFHSALVTKDYRDLWPDLAPPSNEFLIRYLPQAITDTIDSVATSQAKPTPIELTGNTPLRFIPEKSTAQVTATSAHLALTVSPNDYPALQVTMHTEVYDHAPVVRRWVSVHNTGEQPIQLFRVLSLLLSLRPGFADLDLYWVEAFTHPCVKMSTARWRQTSVHQQRLGPNVQTKLRYNLYPQSRDGSIGCMAWAALRDPSLNEGVFLGWEWSGLFDAEIGDLQQGAGVFGIQAGYSDEGDYYRILKPGETFDTPKVFFGFFQGDEEQAGRATADAAEKLLGLPWPEQQPPIFIGHCSWNNWQDFKGSTGHLLPERLDREIELAAELGAELFILDYDWFPRLGDYVSDPKRFPDGVEFWSAKVKKLGMKFGMWMGFGQAHKDSKVVREHPDWLVTQNGQPITGGWGMPAICLGYPPCRDWVLGQVCRVVETFGLDWLKHDFDLIPISNAHHHAPDATDTRIESVRGYYYILEQLHQRYPNLYLDNWTPPLGGHDFGVFQRHHSMMTIDWYTAVNVRSAYHGLTHLFPPTRLHNYCRGFSLQDEQSPYTYRSAFFGNGMYLLNDTLQWSQKTIDLAKREIEHMKSDRDLFRDGRVYNLIPRQPDHFGWEARFVYSPSRLTGMAQVFRNHDPRAEITVRLRGLDENINYTLTYVDADISRRLSGRELMADGIKVTLPNPFSVEILRIIPTDIT